MSLHKMEDATKLRVETKPFRIGMAAHDAPAPRPDLSGLRLKLPNEPAIYLIDPAGYRRWIPDPETYNNLFRGWDNVVIDIDVDDIAASSPLSHGAVLIRAANAAPVYLMSNGMKRWITSPAVMDKYYFSWERIYVLPPAVVDSVPHGPDWT